MKARRALAPALLGMIGAALGVTAWQWQHHGAAPEEMAPELTFSGVDGGTHRLGEWRGRLVLLNFWGTWCAPCVGEIPLLVDAQKRHGPQGLQVVGVAVDDAEPVRRFRERFHMDYPLMIGQNDVFAAMSALGDSIQALPFTVLIGRDGRVLARISGGMQRDDLEALLVRYL
ncbi:MAG TPA: TlpA disulfide reductase family protein [Candidatus Binatia bacterium]|nr:TlpA disulfide reductase family protein [Candidatus Binatia bacterium]